MSQPLRILLVEDVPTDAALVEREIRKEDLDFVSRRVETREEFLAALEEFEPDLILSDYNLPQFDGLSALRLAGERAPEVPFIIITGSLNEETAVECMKAGADDYILKDRLARLVPAIRGAMEKRRLLAERRQAEVELRESEESYRLLFERNLAGVYRSTTDGRLLDCNDALAAIYGYDSREEALAQPAQVFHPNPESRAAFVERLRRERLLKNLISEGRRKDGSPVWVLENASLIPDRRSGEETIEGTIIDVTEQRRAEEEGARLAAAIEQSHESIVMTDLQGTILYVNPAFEHITGYSPQEAVGQNPRILKSGLHDKAFYERMWSTLLAGQPWRGRFTNRRKDGSLFVEESILSPVRDASGTITAFVAAKRDVTQEIELQRKLEQAKRLETVGMIAGGVAHEVRNPLFAITTIVTALERKLKDKPEFGEYVMHIQEQTRRLNALMNDLLTLGRPINPEEFVPLDLRAVLREAKEVVSAGGADTGACLLDLGQEPLEVMGIAVKLQQLFANLGQNALSFTPPGGVVQVLARREGTQALVTVTDAGPGIPADLLPRLFQPFQTGRKGGTGLGLAIVRQIATAHGGTVEAANNDPPPGATFTVRLPLAEASKGRS
ncbi:MAG: PAS domain S-box protein [Acidobacteriota bacterium]